MDTIENRAFFSLRSPTYIVDIAFGWGHPLSDCVDSVINHVREYLEPAHQGVQLNLEFPDGATATGSPAVILREIDTWRKRKGI